MNNLKKEGKDIKGLIGTCKNGTFHVGPSLYSGGFILYFNNIIK